MNTCIVCLGEENNNDLIEYNHCGLYHIHRGCLNRWKKDECIICREKIESTSDDKYNNNFNRRICSAMSVLCPILFWIGLYTVDNLYLN